MIPTVNIDSRRYDDILKEAIDMIPRYCPEWTNLNEGDPGITMLSLFSWMTEMTLKRINKIPQKVYMALLDMLGFSIKPPQAASGVVKFLTDNYINDGQVIIKKGARIGSIDLNAEGMLFSTNDDVVIRNTDLIYCFNKDASLFKQIPVTKGNIRPFSVFDTENLVEYSLYYKSDAFENLQTGNSAIQISFESHAKIFSVKDEIVNYFIWEYWNGESWKELKPTRVIEGEEQRDNVVYIIGPIEDISKYNLNGDTGYYIRSTLADIPEDERVLSLYDIKLKLYSDSEGMQFDDIVMLDDGFSREIDTREPFHIFPTAAQAGDAFYMRYDTLLGKTGVKVFIAYTYSSEYASSPNSHTANKFVDFSYEYFNGKKWVKLDSQKHGFEDTTEGFRVDGWVSFIVPKDISKTKFLDSESYWIRIRISPKNYAYGGSYVKSDKDKKIVWNFDEGLMMPEFDRISISNAPFEELFQKVISYDNFKYVELEQFEKPHDGQSLVKVFNINENKTPGLYLGFSNTLSRGIFNIYLKLDDVKKVKRTDYIGDAFNYHSHLYSNDDNDMLDLQWQVLVNNQWVPCSVVDKTRKFSNSGFVEFMFKKDIVQEEMFGLKACWIRVIKRNGSFESLPYLENILTNCVRVENAVEYKDEMINIMNLDSSVNRYRISSGNLLKGVRIAVNERRIPSNSEVKALRNDGIDTPYVVDGDDVWVEYKEVDNFYNSGVLSRHFVVNYTENSIYFGDGVKGVSPIASGFDVKILEYRIGGGKAGNLAAHKLQYMTENYNHIIGCDNPFACEGGSDIETIDDLRGRASGLLKSLDRAVTNEDFEWLACEASPAVARAHCETARRAGEVRLILVPRQPDKTYDLALYPSRTLMDVVKSYLDDRKVLGVNIEIFPPHYKKFNVNVDVIFNEMYLDKNAEKKKIIDYLTIFYHPTFGGVDKKGWPFGRSISKSGLMKEVETVDSVVKILKVDIFDVEKDAFVDVLSLSESELPLIGDINVFDRYN